MCDTKWSQVNKSVKYIPEITTSGDYNVYFYLPKVKDSSSSITVSIFGGMNLSENRVQTDNLKIEGQTSGVWVPLGKHHFDKNKNGFVEISNKGANGSIAADAVLFVYANNEKRD